MGPDAAGSAPQVTVARARRPGGQGQDLRLPPGEGKPFSLSCKLPHTGYEALQLPYAEPTAYGLGKSGWVSFDPPEDQVSAMGQLKARVEESYRAQAPKKLVRELDERL